MLSGIIIALPGYNECCCEENVNKQYFKNIEHNILILFHTADIINSQKESRGYPGKIKIENQNDIIILLNFFYRVEFEEVGEQESQID
jgi:hypothetical protein